LDSLAVHFEEGEHRDERGSLVTVDERLGLGDAAREDSGLEREVCLFANVPGMIVGDPMALWARHPTRVVRGRAFALPHAASCAANRTQQPETRCASERCSSETL
jgi:hypothetical protein